MIQQTHSIGGGYRAATGAGTYYPAQATELRNTISELVRDARQAQARGEITVGHPKAVIAPHDALARSGPVAASAYASVQAMHATIQRVVLVGAAADASLRGLATPSAEAFDTPLGAVPVDREAVECLNSLPHVSELDAVHATGPVLEVHLPFLIHVLGAPRAERGAGSGFRIVPLLVGEAGDMQIAHALNRMWGGRETLIVVSSNLSRDHDYHVAGRRDRETAHHILDGKIETIGPHDTSAPAAIRGLMHLAWAHRLYPRLLDLRSSGDTGGSRERVVGYGSFLYS